MIRRWQGLAIAFLLLFTGAHCGNGPGLQPPAHQRLNAELPALVPQNGHAKDVTAIAASPDQRRLATGGGEGKILLWDLERGRVLTSLALAPGREINALAFQGDHRIAFAEADSTATETRIELWDLATSKKVRSFEGHPLSFEIGLAVSADGAFLAASGGGRLTIWEIATGDLWVQLAAAGDGVTFLDDRRIVFQSSESMVVVDLTTGPPALRVLPTGAGQAFAVSQGGKVLAHAKADQVTFWDLDSATRIASQQLLDDVLTLAFYGDQGGLLAADRTGHVYRLRGDQWRDLVGFLSLGSQVTGMAPLAAGALATSRRGDGTIFVWSVDAAAPVQRLGFPSPGVTSLDLARDGSLLAVGDQAGTVHIWDLAAGTDWVAEDPATKLEPDVSQDPAHDRVRETIDTGPVPFPAWAPIRKVRLTPVGLLVVRDGGSVELWNVEFRQRSFQKTIEGAADVLIQEGECLVVAGGTEIQRFRMADGMRLEPRAAPPGASALALSNDGKRLAVSGWNEVWVYDKQGNPPRPFSGLASETGAGLDFLASGEALIRSSWNVFERLELATGRATRESGGSRGGVAELGSMLLSGDQEGRVTGKVLGETRPRLEVPAHEAAVRAVVVSENGKVVVTGGEEATIKIWKSDGMRLLASLQLLPGKDWLAFSPNGFFDGTPAGWSSAPFHYRSEPLRVYAPEQFFATFFQPGLLREVVAEGRPIEQTLAARRDARARQNLESFRRSMIPEIRILSPRDTVEYETGFASEGTWSLPGGRSLPSVAPRSLSSVKLTHARVTKPVEVFEAEIRGTGSGVRDCRVFQNRALIYELPGSYPVDARTRTGRLRIDFDVLAGPNELSVYCFNNANVRSEIVRVTVEGADALKRQGKAYIVAAGGNGYSGGLRLLRYAEADAVATLTALQSNLGAIGSYQVVPVLLTDREATRGNLLAALDRLGGGSASPPGGGSPALRNLSKARLEDVVVIFFAGHGAAQGDRYILYPVDATSGPPSAGGITDQELESALRRINAGHVVLILDTCQSGQILETEEKRRGPLNSRGFAQLAYEKRVHVLAASQSYGLAFEDTGLKHGLLTYSLVEDGLGRFLADVAPPDNHLLSGEWLRYPLGRVPELQGWVARARQARGEAFFLEEDGRALRLQQPQVYLPEAGDDNLVIGLRAEPPGASQ